MKPFAKAQHREQAVMYRGQVPHKIEEAILIGSYPLLELLIGECREVLVESTDHKLPRVECSETEESFVCHVYLLPCVL
jgi:hypothetical protein